MSAIKESGDELNPSIRVPANEIGPRERRGFTDYLALAVATCGVGYFPIAPGTLGSMMGVLLYLAVWSWLYHLLANLAARGRLNLLYVFTPQLAVMLLVIFIVSVAGIWAATRAEKVIQKKDPSI